MSDFYFAYFPGSSDSKPSACNVGEVDFDSWVGKIFWRRKWQPTPVFLPGKFLGQRSLVGYSTWGHKESDTTERHHFHFVLCVLLGLVLNTLEKTFLT